MSNNSITKNVLIYILIASLLISGCAGTVAAQKGTNYLYTYTMTQPKKSDQLIFRDEYVYIQFSFDASAVHFQMQNISEASMSIVWEKVSLSVNKRTYSVRNTSNFYSPEFVSPTPLVIPPLGYIRETMIPRENVYREKGSWVEKDLFLSNDRGYPRVKKAITGLIGSEVTLSIPIKIGEIMIDYPFTFKVSNVTPLPSNLLPPVKDRPQAPKISGGEVAVANNLVPIFIAAGILGVAIYLLSKEKTPPTDL